MIAPGTLLLHDNLTGGPSLLFARPRRVLETDRLEDVPRLLAEAEAEAAGGAHVAGYLAYEAGFAFEERLRPLMPERPGVPLVWLGVYDAPRELTRAAARDFIAAAAGDEARIEDLSVGLDEEAYRAAFDRVMEWIRSGDVYQVNLTFRAAFRLAGDPVALYRDLARKQPVGHGAYLDTGRYRILSLSPELFVENRAGCLTARPMKGTIARGVTPAEDRALAAHLMADEKSRAENLMIVDLLRNDLGRVAEIGSVAVPDLFHVEPYRGLHQMTSTVTAELRPGTGFADVMRALFPCGSVTGAPKIRAMQIIRAVENAPRGVYCGSIGHLAPGGDFRFNVAIRTAVIDREGRGEIGIGGGVVADSQVEAEYAEALLKLDFLRAPYRPLDLIETLLYEPGAGFVLLDRHLDRLEASAVRFGIAVERAEIAARLGHAVEGRGRSRVRLVLDEDGGIDLTVADLPYGALQAMRFAVAAEPVNSRDPLLYHKTTRRDFYDGTRKALSAELGVDEAVFLNERGEVCEGSFTNVFVEREGRLLTPALACGLLPGTLRAELIESGRAEEAVLMPEDLAAADAVYLGNSVRGLVPAVLIRE